MGGLALPVKGTFGICHLHPLVGLLTTLRPWGLILIAGVPCRIGCRMKVSGNFRLIALANLSPNWPNLCSITASVVRKDGDSWNMLFPAANSINTIPAENMSVACLGIKPMSNIIIGLSWQLMYAVPAHISGARYPDVPITVGTHVFSATAWIEPNPMRRISTLRNIRCQCVNHGCDCNGMFSLPLRTRCLT